MEPERRLDLRLRTRRAVKEVRGRGRLAPERDRFLRTVLRGYAD